MIQLPNSTIENFIKSSPEVLTSGRLAEGDYTKKVETTVARFMGDYDEAAVLNSCGSGLFVSILYAKMVLGATRVLIQSNTMYGVLTLSHLSGLPVNITRSKDLVMDPNDLKEFQLDNKTVVIYSHIGGSINEDAITKVSQLCSETGAFLIEDGAHTLGSQTHRYGNVVSFSMYATKAIPAGEGGILVGPAELIDWVKRFIMYDRVHMEYTIGLNLRVSEIHALLMSSVLSDIGTIILGRAESFMKYCQVCQDLEITTLYDDPSDHNFYKFIITDDRVIKFFEEQGSIPKKLVSGTPEYQPGDVLTGTVFGYSLTEFYPPESHICLNTNYGVSKEIINRTTDYLYQAIRG